MVRGALLAALALLALPAGARQADPAPEQPLMLAPPPPVDTMPAPRHPQRASAQNVKAVDIPQSAKDEGHNGRATYTATVGPDGRLIGLVLKQGSMSPAIDAAVKARVETLFFYPATDRDGKRVEGTVDVTMAYARHDSDSPGGGIGDYTCADLVREWDWFTAANAARRKLFWPHNAFTSLATIEAMRQGTTPTPEARIAVRAEREAMWSELIARCRENPERLMLEYVDQPQAYANLVNAF